MRLQWAQLGQEDWGKGKRALPKKWNCETELSDRPLRRSQGGRVEIEPRRDDGHHDYGQKSEDRRFG